eukprot:TRINITY_DN193_c0_g1_i6.p2 TRINITY_DN193_c0_g1~~TRINITY_DN193_c0_g1_i6.p2  ORF type:complete len:139 (+),score=12.15 TRINITY_DN193_c0_g1_i6:925-1341(+)
MRHAQNIVNYYESCLLSDPPGKRDLYLRVPDQWPVGSHLSPVNRYQLRSWSYLLPWRGVRPPCNILSMRCPVVFAPREINEVRPLVPGEGHQGPMDFNIYESKPCLRSRCKKSSVTYRLWSSSEVDAKSLPPLCSPSI